MERKVVNIERFQYSQLALHNLPREIWQLTGFSTKNCKQGRGQIPHNKQASFSSLPAACVGRNLTPTARVYVKNIYSGFVLKLCYIHAFSASNRAEIMHFTFWHLHTHKSTSVTAVTTVTSLTGIPWLSWFPTDISYLVETKFSFPFIIKRPAGPSRQRVQYNTRKNGQIYIFVCYWRYSGPGLPRYRGF